MLVVVLITTQPSTMRTLQKLCTSSYHTIVSELNHYMCEDMHRKGRVCGECEPGYGPAVHQAGFLCAKCEWYGVPVYLLLEFVPVTLFLLLFRISLTSAPMISFVIYCQFNFG